ncbi:DUF4233 domain-containing protein [Goodfellowiella coeruleoviolacea]|uniref:DUF4233 domain-containing protein n=1 Tax=Goodfellowiella coeruleoviolacea TaxID=334858 RepID=A0AAE3GCZ1_9PSEU|nr:DUF4233 domain-containing protein [Goodfellowiella coeruleoviolacea]MCP2165099.1 Protein of unknown function (DUF4233) [Goodfellowiella coeruleoviolacea]
MTEQPQSQPTAAPRPPAKDPMKAFRGITAGTLVLEAIVVALAIPVATLNSGGIGTTAGVLTLSLVAALVVTCGLLRFRWAIGVVIALQLVMIASVVVLVPLGVIGILFALVWGYLLWLRRDVAKRMAEGRLPSQQPPAV